MNSVTVILLTDFSPGVMRKIIATYSDWAKQYRSFCKTAITKYGLQVGCSVSLLPSGSEGTGVF